MMLFRFAINFLYQFNKKTHKEDDLHAWTSSVMQVSFIISLNFMSFINVMLYWLGIDVGKFIYVSLFLIPLIVLGIYFFRNEDAKKKILWKKKKIILREKLLFWGYFIFSQVLMLVTILLYARA